MTYLVFKNRYWYTCWSFIFYQSHSFLQTAYGFRLTHENTVYSMFTSMVLPDVQKWDQQLYCNIIPQLCMYIRILLRSLRQDRFKFCLNTSSAKSVTTAQSPMPFTAMCKPVMNRRPQLRRPNASEFRNQKALSSSDPKRDSVYYLSSIGSVYCLIKPFRLVENLQIW